MLSTTLLGRKAVAVLLAAASVTAVAGFAPASAASAPLAGGLTTVDVQQTSLGAQERNKATAVHVLTQLFERADVKVADQHIRADYIQHSPTIPDGRDAFKNYVRDLHTRYPNLKYNVKRVLAQGDLVLVHANPIYEPGTRGVAVMDIFRFDEKGRIAEHWDTVQDVPPTTANGNDMFGTVSNPDTNQPSGPFWQTPLSQKVVVDYFNTLLVNKNPDAVRYLDPKLYQHNPAVPNGTTDMREHLAVFFQQFPNVTADLKRVVADKDYVAVHFRYRLRPEDTGQAIMGIFRVQKDANGELKIIEHWDVIQNIPATSANNNTMF
ncbi:nuclear transport factor 2 family protein [Streptomyces sp. NBC_01233]|uniref:nuclear transport factor 2 family protein n=1 Tax=Streptomyces sp. NBC_01233 TaxID=2903787 RepID=UPI002E14667F|nr:nuclear transport factor 2 family protein [Streptomyces sp. NBC_01233]